MKYLIAVAIIWFTAIMGMKKNEDHQINMDDAVWEVLERLGEDPSKIKPKTDLKNVSAEIGKDIVINGFSNRKNLTKSKRQSKHFVCTSCHNIVKEDPILTQNDPQSRLEYCVKNGIPFLQGTTLYGAVNREYYYNGDYDKKYGDLVKPARENIREAIQLCAIECAQGRKLKEWELESILAFLWEIQIKIGDLNMNEMELNYIENSIADPLSWGNAIAILRSRFLSYSDATFLPPPPDREKGHKLIGNPDNGKLIYEYSCLYCHENKKYSFLHLDNSKMSFKHLESKISTYRPHSIYQVVRYGTYSKYWKKSYMPQYTKEKMSDQMLQDLRAYIEQRAIL